MTVWHLSRPVSQQAGIWEWGPRQQFVILLTCSEIPGLICILFIFIVKLKFLQEDWGTVFIKILPFFSIYSTLYLINALAHLYIRLQVLWTKRKPAWMSAKQGISYKYQGGDIQLIIWFKFWNYPILKQFHELTLDRYFRQFYLTWKKTIL